MMRLKRFLGLLTLNIGVIAILFEITLRLFPGVIPPTLLYRFSEHLKSEIAPGRYSTKAASRLVERSDGGPSFRIRVPSAKAVYGYQDPGSINEVEMDEIGFCNAPNTYAPENISIVALGDSFTWCTTIKIEDAWPAKLSALSDQSVYNLGNPSIGLYEYLELLEQFGIQKKPEIVVMNVYEGNDIRDAIRFKDFQENKPREDKEIAPLLFRLREKFAHTRIGNRSYSVNLAVATARQLYVTLPVKIKGDEINYQYNILADKKTILFNLQNTDTDEVSVAQTVIKDPDTLNVFDDALIKFISLANKHTFVPVVVYTPTSYTTHMNDAELNNPKIAESLKEFSNLQREYFKQQASTLGFNFIDATQLFQSEQQQYNQAGNLLYYQTNLHLTKHGHQLLAEAISEGLSSLTNSRDQPNN